MLASFKNVFTLYTKTSLIIRIIIGLIVGVVLGLSAPKLTSVYVLGDLFVGALKAIAPVLVFFLVSSSLMQGRESLGGKFRLVIFLYIVGTLCAAAVGVLGSFLFPATLTFADAQTGSSVPTNIGEVLKNIIMGMIANPIVSISEGKYLGILFWSALLCSELLSRESPETPPRKLCRIFLPVFQKSLNGLLNSHPSVFSVWFTTIYRPTEFQSSRITPALLPCWWDA